MEESVSAINAKQVQVKFNKPVDKSSAQTIGNYAVTPANSDAVAVTLDNAVLQDDNQTVVVNLNAVTLNSKTTAQYVVNAKNVTTPDGAKTTEFYSIVNLYDNAAPTVAISYPDSNTVKFLFSEPLSTSASGFAGAIEFKLDGVTKYVPASAFTQSTDNTSTGSYLRSYKMNIANSGLAADKNYGVTIKGLTDFASNSMADYSGSITWVKDEVNPVVNAVTVIDTQRLKVEFSEKIKANAPKFAVAVDGLTDAGAVITDYDTSSPDGKTFVVALSGGAKTSGTTNLVTISNFQDLVSNPSNAASSSYMTAVTWASAKPVLTSTVGTVQKIGSGYYAVFTFDRPVLEKVGGTTVTGTYVDSNSITKSAVALALADRDAVGFESLSSNQIAVAITGIATGDYSIDFLAGDVTDDYANGVSKTTGTFSNKSVAIQKSVTGVWVNNLTAATAESTTLASVVTRTTGAKTVYVTFSGDVGTDALDATHYTVDGVQAFSTAIFDNDKQTVKLTLKDGAIASTGIKSFAVTGIAGVDDKVIYKDAASAGSGTSFNLGAQFTENVLPVLNTAKLIDLSNIQLVFSEDMDNATAQNPANYTVKVNGVSKPVTAVESNGTVILNFTGGAIDIANQSQVTVAMNQTGGTPILDKNLNKLAAVSDTAVTVGYADLKAQANVKLADAYALLDGSNHLLAGKTATELTNKVSVAKDALDAAGLTASPAIYTGATSYATAFTTLQDASYVANAKAGLSTLGFNATNNATAVAPVIEAPVNNADGVDFEITLATDTTVTTTIALDAESASIARSTGGSTIITVTISKGGVSDTVTYTVTVPAGTAAATIVRN